MNNKQKGQIGEDIACRYINGLSYKILFRNYRIGKLGELDIIALEHDILVILEVKYRSSYCYGLPEEAIDYKKLYNLRRLTLCFIKQYPIYPTFRIDAISVYKTPKRFRLRHLKDL